MVSDRDLDASWDAAEATAIELSDSGSTVNGAGASVDGSTVTITAGGTYVVSGSLSDGSLVVDADGEKVQLVLDGCSIASSDSAALLVRAAKKVWVTLADGTRNSLLTTGDYAGDDELSIDGALWCKADLTINGAGSLDVESAAGHGIVCKDDLVLVSGEVSVKAARHAIQAKDSACIVGGTWTLDAGTDGVHCGADDDAEKGSVLVAGGTIDITAGSDGFDAGNQLEVDGGEVSVSAGDDGLHAEYALQIDGGVIDVSQSYEGLEGSTVTINDGIISVVSSDDGVNAAGDPAAESGDGSGGAAPLADGGSSAPAGQPGGQPGQTPGETSGAAPAGDMDDYDSTAQVLINGGTLTIQAGGDGIDSNGDLAVTGGETYVFGPTSDGDGSLDFPGTGTISGGIVACAGSTGMAQNFTEATGQASLLVDASGSAGDAIELFDSEGNVLVSFTAATSYACVLVSAPGIQDGQTYTLNFGGNSTEVTVDTSIYTSVSRQQGGMGGPQGDLGAAPGASAPGAIPAL